MESRHMSQQNKKTVYQQVIFHIDDVHVTYYHNKFNSDLHPVDHFKLKSFSISETGYKSHFTPVEAVNELGGEFQYAEALINDLKTNNSPQMPLIF